MNQIQAQSQLFSPNSPTPSPQPTHPTPQSLPTPLALGPHETRAWEKGSPGCSLLCLVTLLLFYYPLLVVNLLVYKIKMICTKNLINKDLAVGIPSS